MTLSFVYFKAIEYGISKEEKVSRIRELLKYAIRKYSINFDDVRIDLGKKRY